MAARKADWVGWILQFFLGLIIGVLCGFAAITTRSGASLISREFVPHFIVGAGLLGAALASYFGDRLWMECKVIPLDGPDQSPFSLELSLTFGVAGGALMTYALLKTLGLV